jgi:hypothetical protein
VYTGMMIYMRIFYFCSGIETGLSKTRFKKTQPSGFFGFYWNLLGFIVFWVSLGFLNFCPLNSFFLPVFVLFNYLLADEFKIK